MTIYSYPEHDRRMEEKLKSFLDNSIRYWRKKKQEAGTPNEHLTASCYVDAYQSVRVSMFNEVLPKEDKE
jgi:hypothetical protein